MARESKRKGVGYSPKMKAQAEMNKKSSGGGGFESQFLEVRNLEDGKETWFRALPFPEDVVDQFGEIAWITLNGYMFPHPCLKSKKDSKKPQWVKHFSEASLDSEAKEGDSFKAALAAAIEEDPDNKTKLQAWLFPNPKFQPRGGEILDDASNVANTEEWVLVQPVQEDLGEDGESIPIGRPIILVLNWTVRTALFGAEGSEAKGLWQTSDIGDKLWSQLGGVDFSITRHSTLKKYITIARRSDSDIDESVYDETKWPKILDLIEKGIQKTEDLQKMIDVKLGLDACDDGEENDEQEEDAPKKKEDTSTKRKVRRLQT